MKLVNLEVEMVSILGLESGKWDGNADITKYYYE